MGIFTPGINKGAYQGGLTCPYPNMTTGVVCGSNALRFVENVTPYRLRYRCRKCGKAFQYDISNRPVGENPYAAYRKGRIWSDIDRVLRQTGAKLKRGAIQ